MTNISLIIVLF